MNASDFDAWVKLTRSALEENREKPEGLSLALLARLRNELYTWDSSVLDVVHAWRGFESATGEPPGPAPYAITLQLIDSLRPYVEQRPRVRASLLTIKGDIFLEGGKLQPAAEAFETAVAYLHGLHLDVDTQRMYSMVRLGFVLLHQGNKKDSEQVFLDVLSYPWFLVMEADVQDMLRQYYIDAGLGLIECRRGNRKALADINFVPAVEQVLLPELEAALKEAGNDQ